MKKQILLSAAILLGMIYSCTSPQEQTAKVLLTETKLRGEIFDEIVTNEKYMNELVNRMVANEGCKAICTDNVSFVRLAWESKKMDSIIMADMKLMGLAIDLVVKKMEDDSNTCNMVCNKFIENDQFKAYMIKYATQKKGKDVK